MKWAKKHADIRLSNMQQTITKIWCLTLQSANFFLENKNPFQDNIGVNNHYHNVVLSNCIISPSYCRFVKHAKGLSESCIEARISASTEIPHSSYLFGEDFEKLIKEVEETNKITKAFKPVSLKPRETAFSNFRNPNQVGGSNGGFPRFRYRRDFLWPGPRPQGFRKKCGISHQSKDPEQKSTTIHSTPAEILKVLEQLSVSDYFEFLPKLDEFLRYQCDSFRAGRIKSHIKAWRNITKDREILSYVSGANVELESPPDISHRENTLTRKFNTKRWNRNTLQERSFGVCKS